MHSSLFAPARPAPAHRRKRHMLAAAALAAGGLAAQPASVLAQSPGNPAATPAAGASQRYDIPEGPLGAVLNRFAQRAGIALSYPPDLAEGKRSPGVSGEYTVPAAFEALLQGTGLRAVGDGSGSYSLRSAPQQVMNTGASAGSTVLAAGSLAEVRVTANAENDAWGPVSGYIARRSASATKSDTPLVETPQSVTVVSRQQMDDRGVQTMTEAIQYSAGITGDNAADNRYDKPVIRGFAARQFLDGTYLVYGTGVYNMPRIEPYGLEKVEILRGPSSVLYGANAPGGLVNMISKRPGEQQLREVGLLVGSYGRQQAQFDLGGKADDNGIVTWRLTGIARSGGTQTDYADDDRVFIAPAVTIRPSARTQLTLMASYQKDKLGTLINFLPREGTLTPTQWGTISSRFFTGEPDFNRFDREGSSAGWSLSHAFTDSLTFRQNARYLRSDMVYQGVYAVGWQPGTSYLRRASLDAYGDLDSFVIDNQLEWKQRAGDWQHTVLAGFDYQKASSYEAQGYGTVGSGLGLINPFAPVYGQRINPITSYTGTEQHQEQSGVYAQYQGSFAERWFLTGSLRRDQADSQTLTTRFTNLGRVTSSATADMDQSDTTYRLGLLYRTANGFSPYLSYSTSFLPQPGVDHLNNPFKPTTAKQSEVGLKYDGLPGWQFTGSLYDLRQENVVASLPEAGITARRQIGEVRSRGLELEAQADLGSGVRMTGAWTLMDMEILKGAPAEVGKTPTNRPRDMFSVWLDKTLREGQLAGLGFGLGVRYMGSSWGDSANTFKVPDATVLDAAIRYATGPWRFSLNIGNLLDKEYIGTCGSATTCYYEYRRTATLSASYAF